MATEQQAKKTPKEKTHYDLSDFKQLLDCVSKEDEKVFKNNVFEHLKTIIKNYELESYKFIILYDEDSDLSSYHSNQIYESASKNNNEKDILLIIHSLGGHIEPAYLISKTCKRLSKKNFITAVPRKAKSAATLITMGSDEIHMGFLSELGPIDPQISKLPALALTNALNKLAQLTSDFPKSASMFAQYLTSNLRLEHLGYFERITESAAQYAKKLLSGKKLPQGQTVESLANHFVYHYKDHGFVIDIDEVKMLFGQDIAKENSKEYECANEIYTFLDRLKIVVSIIREKDFSFVGDIESGIRLDDRPENK